jgi:hypothetical protein
MVIKITIWKKFTQKNTEMLILTMSIASLSLSLCSFVFLSFYRYVVFCFQGLPCKVTTVCVQDQFSAPFVLGWAECKDLGGFFL